MCRRRARRPARLWPLAGVVALLALVIAGVARGPARAEQGYFRVIELSAYSGMVVRVDADGTIGPGLAGVQVNLLDPAGRIVRQVETDAAGYYTFERMMLAARAPEPQIQPDLSGIVMELRDMNGYVVMTTTTTITGSYYFEVGPGTWEVCVRTETLPSFMRTQVHDFDGVGSEHCAKTLIVNDNNLEMDFGYGW